MPPKTPTRIDGNLRGVCRQAASQLAKCGHMKRKMSSTGKFVPSKRRAALTPQGPSLADMARQPRKDKPLQTRVKKAIPQKDKPLQTRVENAIPAPARSKTKKSDNKIVKKMEKADVNLREVKEILRDYLKNNHDKSAKRDADLQSIRNAKSYADPIFAKYWKEALKDEIKFLTAADKIKTNKKKEKKAFKKADFSNVKDMLETFQRLGESKQATFKQQVKELEEQGVDFKKNLQREKKKDRLEAIEEKKNRAKRAAKKAAKKAKKGATKKIKKKAKTPKPPTPKKTPKPPTPKKAARRIAPLMVTEPRRINPVFQ